MPQVLSRNSLCHSWLEPYHCDLENKGRFILQNDTKPSATGWIKAKRLLAWSEVEASWNVMAHAQKPDFVFRRNGRVHLNRRGHQFSRLLAAEVCASAVVMLDTPCSEIVWRVLATQSIQQFPLQFRSRASPCAITFQLESKTASSGLWRSIIS